MQGRGSPWRGPRRLLRPRWDSCRDVGPEVTSRAPAPRAGQRWLMGLKAPASGVGPVMLSHASRGLWAEARRGGSSETDNIIAYAWRGKTRDTGGR